MGVSMHIEEMPMCMQMCLCVCLCVCECVLAIHVCACGRDACMHANVFVYAFMYLCVLACPYMSAHGRDACVHVNVFVCVMKCTDLLAFVSTLSSYKMGHCK